jgi:RNA polymerase sigma-70 factor, ECF subfamily
VYRELIRLCGGDVRRAEDLTHDTFVAGLVLLQRDPAIELSTGWFITVARRLFVDSARRWGAEQRSLARFAGRPVRQVVDPAELTSSDALGLMTVLSDEQRLAVTLRYVHDQSLADVAAALGRSAAATESLLARARRRLADACGGDVDEER